ncbi:ABC-F family ATP-binding cassette domain-containing protein [Pedobacter sp. P351]|uniref:ribosomal protection-like ABC-F family protein n=1 Tax=Pedobacter superstes TaxID=3133441 RepID=UPI0030B42B2C
MLILQNISYIHPNKDFLFDNINLNIHKQNKTALIGNNGAGKSTLLKIIAGILQPSGGTVNTATRPYYIPQLFGQFNDYSIGRALRVEDQLNALTEILDGKANETNLLLLDDDWTIEERCKEALAHWELSGLDLTQKMETLSGGQKTKIFLAGISIHQPEIILMDEPSNHLDTQSRGILYDFIQTTSSSLVVVSHDRKLLNMLDPVYELSKRGINVYGGNYSFYTEQKMIESNALIQGIKSKEKALRKAKEVERDASEKQQKLDARGKKKQEKAGLPTISMKTFKNNAEKSTARLKDVHSEKTGNISQELSQLRKETPEMDRMKFCFDNSALHRGKILVTAQNLNFSYEQKQLWEQPLNFLIASGERIAIKGHNGSGKTTLIKIILGEIKPQYGSIHKAVTNSVYIDQDYSLIDNNLSVYEQAQKFNSTAFLEHEIKIRLSRFLFSIDYWDKPCKALSGGEKMRLMLCCLTIINQAPDIIIFDEPTNNLDIQNIEILTAATNDYQGTLLVISHDEYFLEQINVKQTIELK